MGKAIGQNITRRILVVILALIAGAAFVSAGASTAHAAEGGDGPQGLAAGSGPLTTQYTSFTTAMSAPSSVPSNTASRYEVYPTYFFFGIGADGNLVNYKMYMDIWPTGKPQQMKTYSFGSYVQTYTIKGLRPNTKYTTRLYYGFERSESYYFSGTGRIEGAKSKTVTFKTGPNKKPALKSVKVKAINYRVVKRRAYNTNFLLWWRHPYTYNEYRYKQRTTVTFKKAPKTKFVFIKYTMNGLEYVKRIKVKKGQKTYVVTSKQQASIYNPHKRKSTVSVATYQNKTWKGYSKLWSGKRKIG